MAKPELWRLDASTYRVSHVVPTRYQDLDPMGHINNVAMAGMFETARVHFHHHLGRHPADQGVRWLVAAVELKYVLESHFPHDVTVHSAVGAIGNSSWTLISAAFQNDECVATCDTVMAVQGPRGARIIDDEMRATMERNMPLRADL
ncbi:MAG: acyl-CoA thioesterase [Sphingobium sp.]